MHESAALEHVTGPVTHFWGPPRIVVPDQPPGAQTQSVVTTLSLICAQ